MDTRKIYLNKNKSVNSVNEQNFVGIDLSTKSKLLPYNDVSDILNLNDLYIKERNNCRKYRLILTVNPICTNVLYNYRTEVVRKEGSPDVTFILGDAEQPEPPQPTEYTLEVDPTEIVFPSSGGSSAMTVVTENQGWELKNLCHWITASKISGEEGESEISFTVLENTDTQEKECKFSVKGTEEKEVNVTIKQLGAVLPGIESLKIVLNMPEIPASGGSVNTSNISYTVYAVYEDSSEIMLPNSELSMEFTEVVAQSKEDNVDEDGQHTEVRDATLTITYSGITSAVTQMVYQQPNKVERTWEISGKTSQSTSGWTVEGRNYYEIDVTPLELSLPSTSGETDINVHASGITANTIYSADTWQEEITPWSAYTSLYEKSGNTVVLEEIHVENERIVKEDKQFREVGTRYTQSSLAYPWITASTVENGISHVVWNENTNGKVKTAKFRYCVNEDTSVYKECNVTQQAGVVPTTRKVEIYVNKYISGEDLNIECRSFNNAYNGAFNISGDRDWSGSLEFTGQYLPGGRSSWTYVNNGKLTLETSNMNAMTCTFYFTATDSPGPFDAAGTGFFQNLNDNIVSKVPVAFTYRIPSGIAGTTTTVVIDKTTTNLTFIKT